MMRARAYDPCRNGLHVCAISWADPFDPEFVTEANVCGVSSASFYKLCADYALAEDEDPDLVVDLMVDGDIIGDFPLRRQNLAALLHDARASPSQKDGGG